MKCIVKVKELHSPYMKDWRGYRILVAHCNMDGHKPFSKEPAPRFDGQYLIAQFGDYEDTSSLDRALRILPKELTRRGFETYDMIGEEQE